MFSSKRAKLKVHFFLPAVLTVAVGEREALPISLHQRMRASMTCPGVLTPDSCNSGAPSLQVLLLSCLCPREETGGTVHPLVDTGHLFAVGHLSIVFGDK